MDDNNRVIRRNRATTTNALGKDISLEKSLQLNHKDDKVYFPLTLEQNRRGHRILENAHLLYRGDDPEYNPIHDFFDSYDSIIFGYGDSDPVLPFHHVLNLSNTAEDVRFRQEGIKEVTRNRKLYNAMEKILEEAYLYDYEGWKQPPYRDIHMRIDITPEKIKKFVDSLSSLSKCNPQSESIHRLIEWAENFQEDTMFNELLREKRKITDSRVIAIYSERFKDVRYGLLKPGVKSEDVFDFLAPDVATYELDKYTGRRNKPRTEVRSIVKHKFPGDKAAIGHMVGHARQRMDVLNEVTSQMSAIPVFLMHSQMKHLYQGAFMHKQLRKRGLPMTFPEISDNSEELEVEDIYPIRMVLGQYGFGHRRSPMALNSFSFNPEDRIIQVEGPNKRGKSEAWRTMHLLNVLTNAGHSVPAKHVRKGVVPNSHFISCKGKSGHGGSELARSLWGVQARLDEIHNGDMVVLDELGDATNAPTGLEISRRLLPHLIDKGCRVYVTTHHDALTDYISNELNGVSLMPNPNEKEIKMYGLVPATKDIDFRAEETLDDMNFTVKEIEKRIPNESRPSPRIKIEHRYMDDRDRVPF